MKKYIKPEVKQVESVKLTQGLIGGFKLDNWSCADEETCNRNSTD